MVCGGLCLVHPSGLHLSHCGEGNRLRDVQDRPGPAHRALHEDPQFAEAAETLPAYPLHTPVGGGKLLFGFKRVSKPSGSFQSRTFSLESNL